MKTFCKLTAQSPAASYVPLPRFLLQDEALRDISNDAKVLYALLLDRASISRQNGYVEPDGTIRLYFTLEQAQTKLHRSRQSVTRIFRELEYSGLIIRKKQGLGKPALITLNYPADAKLIQPREDGAISHNKSRKQGVFCPTSAEKTQGNIFSHNTSEKACLCAYRSDKGGNK